MFLTHSFAQNLLVNRCAHALEVFCVERCLVEVEGGLCLCPIHDRAFAYLNKRNQKLENTYSLVSVGIKFVKLVKRVRQGSDSNK